jgi:coniferyl-aldehyde dehydrogenase
MENSPTERLYALLECQRSAFAEEMNPGVAVRKDRLARLAAMGEKHADEIVAAISADFGHRSAHETQMAELVLVGATIRHAERHLKRWMKPRRMPTALHYRPGSNRLLRQPLGVVGVVAPWNYPYQLALAPAVAAIGLRFRDPDAFARRCRDAGLKVKKSSRGHCVSLPPALGGAWVF